MNLALIRLSSGDSSTSWWNMLEEKAVAVFISRDQKSKISPHEVRSGSGE